MKIKVSDYIADFLAEHDISQTFCVVGGGAMHLNDSLGHHPRISCMYHHHEQACAMAAEGYARLTNKPALVCVTSGPGAINALNGVVGAYQDSIPMIVISGQTKTTLTVRSSGLKLRTLGNQEFDIVSALDNAAKYSEMIMDAGKIRYCLEKAYHLATTGRMGPCWLDIPLDIQGSYVETEELESYFDEKELEKDAGIITRDKLEDVCKQIAEKLKTAKRPVIYAGNGIRLAGAAGLLKELARKISAPIVTCWDSIDLAATEDPYYCGRGGIMGDRAGNFAVQNSDLLLSIGSRLNVYQVGYQIESWAREAYTVVVDIDREELKKQTVRIDMPVCADAKDFISQMIACADGLSEGGNGLPEGANREWLEQCRRWKKEYPVVQEKHFEEKEPVNVYAFMGQLGRHTKGIPTVVTNGSACVVGSQSYYIGSDDRFLMNCGLSSMGYGLPAAIGVCVGNHREKVVCVEGDGSIMMNLQELQTMMTNRLPIKLFIINNNGYHQIRQTQNNIFHNGLVGVGPESGDLGFPEFKKVAEAFQIRYEKIENNDKIDKVIDRVIETDGAVLCEVFVSTTQYFEPKSATKRLEDGSLYSPPLEDMAPFLSREELKKNMYIPLMDEK